MIRRMYLAPPVFEGAGTYNNPYRINSAKDLNQLQVYVNAGNASYTSACYLLATDIDLIYYSPWTPIGSAVSYKQFTGIFDGGFHKISNLNISFTGLDAGLFGYCNNATIKNLGIESGLVIGLNQVGAIVGNAQVCIISNCYNKSTVKSVGTSAVGYRAGGICGLAVSGSIINCANYGAIINESTSGTPRAGGISGYGYTSTNIIRCFNSGNISGTGVLYALVGQGGTVTNSYYDSTTTGTVTAQGTARETALCTGSTALDSTGYCSLLLPEWFETVSYPVPANFANVF